MSFNPFTDCLKFLMSFTSDIFLAKYSCDFSGFVSRNPHLLTISTNRRSILIDAPAVAFSYFSSRSTISSIVCFSSSVKSCCLLSCPSLFSLFSLLSSVWLFFLLSVFSVFSFAVVCCCGASGFVSDCSLEHADNDTAIANAKTTANFLRFFISSSLYIYIIPLILFSNQFNIYDMSTFR